MNTDRYFGRLFATALMRAFTTVSIKVLPLLLIFPIVPPAAEPLTKVGSWGGSCRAVFPYEWNERSLIALGIGTRLEIFDLNDTITLLKQGEIETGGYVRDIVVDGGIAYVAASDSGMRIIDIANPQQPRIIGTYYYLYARPASIRLAKRKNTVFLADTNAGIFALDVTDPSRIAVRELTGSFNPGFSVLIHDSSLYAGTNNDVREYIFTETDSLRLRYAAECCRKSFALAATNTRVFAGISNGIQAMYLPHDPLMDGACICRKDFHVASDVIADGNRLFIASQDSGVYVFDIEDNNCLTQVYSYSEPWPFDRFEPEKDGAWRLAKRRHLLYVAYGRLGLKILDLSDGNSAPVKKTELTAYNYFATVTISDTLAFVGDERNELCILSISDPLHPRLLATTAALTPINDITVASGFAYVASWNAGLQIFDVSNPLEPQNVCWATHDTSSVTAYYNDADVITVMGTTLYLSNDQGIEVFDISNNFAPVKVASLGSQTFDLIPVSDSLLYTAQNARYNGIYIYRIGASPQDPESAGSLEPLMATLFIVSGNRLYTALGHRGMQVIDISNPSFPALVGSEISVPKTASDEPGYATGMQIDSSDLFIGYSDEGIYHVDITDPDKPVYTKMYRLPGGTSSLDKQNDYIFSTGGDGGLQILATSNRAKVKPSSGNTVHGGRARLNSTRAPTISLDGRLIRPSTVPAPGVHIILPVGTTNHPESSGYRTKISIR